MDLHESIEQYQQQFMREEHDPKHELRSAALALLEEFLGDYASLETLEALSVEDLEEFFIDWYLRRPGAQAAVAVALLDTVRGWLGWCDATYGCRLDEAFAPLCDRLRVDLPRILEAWQVIAERLRRSRHEEEAEAGLAGLGSRGGPSLISSGINRVIRPAEIDYSNAHEDYFCVEAVTEESVTLQSPTGQELGEEAIGPVRVPKRAAALLRAGDVLYVEVAPGQGAWEILEVSQALPVGYRLTEGYACASGKRADG
jgi:hypothetical protein